MPLTNPEIAIDQVQIHGKTFVPMLSAEEIQHAVSQIASEISADYESRNPLCIAILNGAFIFAADLVRALNFDPQISFIKVASYRALQSSGKIKEIIGLETDLKGRDVIVIEDIVDTGHTISYLHQQLKSLGASSVAFTALLFKADAYKYDIPIRYVGIRIPDRFVIGYGLDYDGHGRSLKGVYVLKDEQPMN